jgi:peptide deformylase
MRLGEFERGVALRIFPDPALRLRAQELNLIDDSTARLAHFMVEVMIRSHGAGLAANQIGILQRLVVIAPEGSVPLALINPVIEWEGLEMASEEEGCLSLPGVLISVTRPAEVTVSARDLSGEEKWYELSGPAARIVQHELDHLDGKLIIDRAPSQAALREALTKAVLRGFQEPS